MIRAVKKCDVRGRASFIAGCAGLILFGAVHLLAVYNANLGEPRNDEEARLRDAARALASDIGPFHATAWGGIQILNCSYSILLLHLGALNLAVIRPLTNVGRLRTAAGLNVCFTGLILGVTILFQFPPPMIFAALCFALFLTSWIRQASIRPRAPGRA